MKRLLWFLAAAIVALAGAVWWFNYGSDEATGGAPPEAPPTPERIARGGYLARAGNCMTCHTERGGAPYAGGRAIATPFGTVYAGNLTPDPDTGLGRWSAADFRRALRSGRSRDGRLLYPAFPYTHFTRVTAEDADAIYDFLRSLTPVKQANRPHELEWPYSTQAALAVWRTLYFRRGAADAPGATPEWNRGAYLVRGLGHCSACHAPRNAMGATRDLMDLSGGLIPMQNWYAPSLTSANEAGVASWSTDEVVALLRTGVSPRGSVMGPMAEVVLHSTQHLDEADLRAMATFLRELPSAPGAGDTDPRVVHVASPQERSRGARVYERHCAACHGERGEGRPGAYPRLAGSRAVLLPESTNLVQAVLHGGFPPATQGNPRPFGMPPFALELSDADIAAVLSYVRSSWGNRAAPVSELAVSRVRDTTRR